MNKFTYLLASTALAGVLALPNTADAQSAKATGVVQKGGVLFGGQDKTGGTIGNFPNTFTAVPGMSTSIKAPHGKELAIDLSLLCGVFTETTVKSKGGNKDTDSAGSKIKARVKIEPDPDGTASFGFAEPGGAGGVVFCDRQQTLSATLGGIITNLSSCTGGGSDPCVLSDEEITLGIKTLNANAFNFFALNLDSSDDYTLTVQAQLDTCKGTSAVTDEDPSIGDCETIGGDTESDTKAFGFITGGSMFVEEVRFTQGDAL